MSTAPSGRIVPVRDRVITAIQRKLLTIQATNGYAFSLTGVYRRPGDAWTASFPPEAYLYFGRSQTGFVTGTQDKTYERLSMQVRAFAESLSEDIDREASILLADIQRCLDTTNSPIEEPFAPKDGDIWLKQVGSIMAYPPPDSGIVAVLAFYTVTFGYMSTDPRLFSDVDSWVYESQLLGNVVP